MKLGEILTIKKGKKPPTLSARSEAASIRFIKIDEIRGKPEDESRYTTLSTSLVFCDTSDVLIVWDGAYSGLVGTGLTGAVGSTIAKLTITQDNIYPLYVKRFIQSKFSEIQENTTGAAIPHVNGNHLRGLEIPLPPIDEQKRIAAVLDKADALRRLRQQSLDLTEKLIQSVFLDMFVHREGAQEWTRRPVEECAKDYKGSIRTGPFGSQLKHSEFVEEGIAVLGIDNAVQNKFKEGKPRFITEEKYEDLKRYRVYPDDVIITIMGTVGRCAIVPADIPLAINTKHLCCITLDKDVCLPGYLHACFLNHPEVLEQLGIRAKGAVMPGLNMGIIKELKIPIPPIELQKDFKKKIKALRDQTEILEGSRKELEKLFFSLQQRAFRGELDLSNLILEEEAEEIIEAADKLNKLVHETLPRTLGSGISLKALKPSASLEKKLKSQDKIIEDNDQIPWSPDYFKFRLLAKQPAEISITDLMSQAESVFTEPNYDAIRDILFDYLDPAQGKPVLTQTFDEKRKEIILQPA